MSTRAAAERRATRPATDPTAQAAQAAQAVDAVDAARSEQRRPPVSPRRPGAEAVTSLPSCVLSAPPTTHATETDRERLYGHLKRLSLHTIAQVLADEARTAATTQMSYTAFLARLMDIEVAAKADRSVQARLSMARFPVLRTLEAFDFSFQPGLSAARIKELAELAFLGRAENVVFVGRPGTGKTH